MVRILPEGGLEMNLSHMCKCNEMTDAGISKKLGRLKMSLY